MQIWSDLPPPIGTASNDLIRVPARALPADLDYLIPAR